MATTTSTWPVIDKGAVCALQDLGGAGTLLLNGTLSSPSLPSQVSFINAGFIRSVSITSTNNLSGVTFTITGFQNEALVTETITGPNNTTVYGTMYYDIIAAVTTSGAVTQVSVGTGSKGYLPIVQLSTFSASVNYSCAILLPAGSGITYSIFQALAAVNPNFIAFQNQENTNFFPISSSQTTSQILNFTAIANYILLKIVSSTTPTTDTLVFTFMQF